MQYTLYKYYMYILTWDGIRYVQYIFCNGLVCRLYCRFELLRLLFFLAAVFEDGHRWSLIVPLKESR